MTTGQRMASTLLLMTAAILTAAGCDVNRATASLTASPDGRYLVQSGGGQAALWTRQGNGWRLLWRRVAAVNSLALVAGDGEEPLVILGAGRNLKALNRQAERWSAEVPSGLAVRKLGAADLNGDGRDEVIALCGRTLGGEAQTLLVLDMAGREAARLTDVHTFIAAMASGDLDGDNRPELAVAEHGQDGAHILRVLALAPEGLSAKDIALKLPAGFEDLAAADLDGDGRDELVASLDRLGRSGLKTYRWKDGGLHAVGKALAVDGTGDLLPIGRKLVALRVRNGRWWSHVVLGWQVGGLAVRTRLERFRAGAILVPAAGEALELLVAGPNGPQRLLRIE